MFKKPDVWDRELREIRIDRDEIIKNSNRYRIGSVRLAMGRVCTQEEFDEEKQKIISKPLP
ncbi:MAG: hypothetical protein Q7U51_12930 [Methanoregula sp.]|nr:hypothetical protein [Methanoregula sp.]